MAINDISALSLQPLKFTSSIKDTGSDITVANKLHTNTTISSDGNILITWICKMLWQVEGTQQQVEGHLWPNSIVMSLEKNEPKGMVIEMWSIWLQGLHREPLPLPQYWYSAHDFSLSTWAS